MSAEPSLRLRPEDFGLSADEFVAVERALGRSPNALEAAMFGAMWSEHCGYKNSRPLLRLLPTEGPQVLQGPGENAGVVDLGDGDALAFKMESHNHPSAVEPVQGAATGVGGILRDIFAMGARPFAVLDSLRFGPLDEPRNRYLLEGVVEGIAHYGNAIGVPTVGGEIRFHPCYSQNPLVNVMALGLLRVEDLQSGTVGAVGNRLIYVGSKTGRDGLGGAVFASADLSDASDADRPAVQVGDPFMEKLLLEACLDVVERGLVVGVQDMGAAGITSSVGEMAHRAALGVDLHVDRVPRREGGMTPLEVLLSESQERMVLVALPERVQALERILTRYELDAVDIGGVADHGRFRIYDAGVMVGDLPVAELNDAPTYVRDGVEDSAIAALRNRRPEVALPDDLGATLLALLASPTIASKRPVYERYDHQVMTNTVVPPGAGDAAVLRLKGRTKGVAATIDCNGRYLYLDPYLGAVHAVAEAARNLSCVGAEPLGVTDNLNFGNPTRPEVYYQLERSVAGLRDACTALGTPVTGGNVSLYNQYRSGDDLVAIHPTPTVGMVGLLADVSRHATLALRREGDVLLLIGPDEVSLGATSYLAEIHGQELGPPPAIDLDLERSVQHFVRDRIASGACDTAHDCSDGGLAVAVAEMAIAGGFGVDVTLPGEQRADVELFGEGAARILISLEPVAAASALAELANRGIPGRSLGRVGGSQVVLRSGDARISVPVNELERAHEGALREVLS
jgi:phosphoribosylformylglycinamidine synthase